ncbi:cysteine hydrolase [Uliginosibacterium sp. H1]|uniref:cysteine hydrolase n=1 Tax=Uliginosibacterium sp. H1 TaxID=3114757 RepID=UPI002E186473|nr:cysteine hydrolase [Uliginosibacterium sp. H1]
MAHHAHLLIIDPQNDFCDLPADYLPEIAGHRLAPALPVPGAHADMLRVAGFIRQAAPALAAISVTLDSHQHIDIGHPTFWRLADGNPPEGFTPVTLADFDAGRITPRDPAARDRVRGYLHALEATGRYTHMVWPLHCEIGSWGHNIHAAVLAACNAWEDARGLPVARVMKGSNPWTEHYSAIKAEVPDPADPATQGNPVLIAALAQADTVFIAGEAASHCVKATTEHIVEALGASQLRKLVLLTDCMSPVAGFEAAAQGFLADMQGRGLRMATAAEALGMLPARR